jgi:hypothetical protein
MDSEQRPPSYGNMSDQHWSRTRKERNREALEYYLERSRKPGVEAGGAERNFYCMECEGVIPFELRGRHCPHCKALLDEHVQRYFNWVEINEPPESDLKALMPFLIGAIGLLAVLGLAFLAWSVWGS